MDQIKIGRFIAAARKQKGLTQEQLGDRMGVTNKTVSRWETGKYMPDIDKLQELSGIFGISVNELLAGERVEDAAEFVKIADENLIEVLSKESAFCLQDRIVYYKRKWMKEHIMLILFGVVLWCLILGAAIFTKRAIVFTMVPVMGFAIYGYIRNQMMIYVEDRAFV